MKFNNDINKILQTNEGQQIKIFIHELKKDLKDPNQSLGKEYFQLIVRKMANIIQDIAVRLNIDDYVQLYNDLEKIVFNMSYKEAWTSILDDQSDKDLE